MNSIYAEFSGTQDTEKKKRDVARWQERKQHEQSKSNKATRQKVDG